MKNKTSLIVFVSFLLLILPINLSSAEIIVNKTAPSQVNFGEVLTVNIVIENTVGENVQTYVKEYVGNVDVISPLDKLITPKPIPGIIALEPRYLLWNVSVGPLSKQTLEYKIKPKTIGIYTLSYTIVYAQNKSFYSNTLSIDVLAIVNGRCEVAIGENYFNSRDCPSGSSDNVCDGLLDNKCDPDCSESADADCKFIGVAPGAPTGKTIYLEATVYPLWQKILFFAVIGIVVIAVIVVIASSAKRARAKKYLAPPSPILPPPLAPPRPE